MRAMFYDGVYTLAGRVLRAVLALVLSIVVARILGPQARGEYALGTVVYAGIVLSAFAGISSAVSYFMLNVQAGSGVLRPALVAGALFSAFGAVPVAAMAHFGHNDWAVVPSILLLPCNVPAMLLLGYALGTKRVRWQTTFLMLSTACTLFAMALAFLLFPHTSATAIAAYVTVSVIIAAAALTVVVRDARKLHFRDISLRAFILFALRVGIVSVVSMLNYRADLYVVALLAAPAILGQYAVAVAAAEGLLVITQVVAVATSPHVGSMEVQAAARLTAQSVRATFAVAAVICAVFFLAAPYIVRVLYGAAYLPMVPALRVLLGAVLILSIGSPLSNFFTLKLGKPEVALLSAACAAALCILCSLLLVPRIGMLGAAAATAAAYTLGEGIRTALFVRATGVTPMTLFIPTRRDIGVCAHLGTAIVHDMRRRFTSAL